MFPCLGITAFGTCSYNPAQPTTIYFSIGDAIAALGFTLAIQQLFRPIYLFRLRAYGLKVIHLTSMVFLGAACSIVAMILPNLPLSHKAPLEYPILWELAGGLLIGIAYGAAAFISLWPARINTFNLKPFARAASVLLSASSDEDRANFADDLLRGRNLERLIKYTSTWRHVEGLSASAEFSRLRSIGAPLSISGPVPLSPFVLFTYRKALDAASIAGTFLRIIADPAFCSVLVRKCPWLTSGMLERLSERHLYVDQAKPFIQEIASQAILNEDSMMAREIGYTGFGTMPLLSMSLFGNDFILSSYDPIGQLDLNMPKNPSAGFVARLNGASKMMLATAIQHGSYWHHYMTSIRGAYESLCRQWSYARYRSSPIDYSVELHMGLRQLYKDTVEGVEKLSWERRKSLFAKDSKEYSQCLVEDIASIIYESLNSIANTFTGFDDDAWTHATIISDIYPIYGDEPEGMNSLQQQLAVKILGKLRQNMEGRYPALSRVLLSVVGPYGLDKQIKGRTAFVILRDAIYKELQKLPDLYAAKPDKVTDFLPSIVTYQPEPNTLTQVFRFGSPFITHLSELEIPDIDLFSELNWQNAGE